MKPSVARYLRRETRDSEVAARLPPGVVRTARRDLLIVFEHASPSPFQTAVEGSLEIYRNASFQSLDCFVFGDLCFPIYLCAQPFQEQLRFRIDSACRLEYNGFKGNTLISTSSGCVLMFPFLFGVIHSRAQSRPLLSQSCCRERRHHGEIESHSRKRDPRRPQLARAHVKQHICRPPPRQETLLFQLWFESRLAGLPINSVPQVIVPGNDIPPTIARNCVVSSRVHDLFTQGTMRLACHEIDAQPELERVAQARVGEECVKPKARRDAKPPVCPASVESR